MSVKMLVMGDANECQIRLKPLHSLAEMLFSLKLQRTTWSEIFLSI